MKKRIDLLLVENQLAETRTKAQAMIMAGQVFVEDNIVKKSGETYLINSKIVVKNLNSQWVSRGAYKLEYAIKHFNIKIRNLTCLDIGASTGGFTEVLLDRNAKKIYAVDVGVNQLHEKLKKEKKIIDIPKTNARYLDQNIIKETIDLIVCDASFISLKKVLKSSLSFLNTSNGKVVALIKPQFEATKNEVKKGGVVRDPLVHERICNDIVKWFKDECKMNIVGLVQSPIKGPKGNIEFLILAEY